MVSIVMEKYVATPDGQTGNNRNKKQSNVTALAPPKQRVNTKRIMVLLGVNEKIPGTWRYKCLNIICS